MRNGAKPSALLYIGVLVVCMGAFGCFKERLQHQGDLDADGSRGEVLMLDAVQVDTLSAKEPTDAAFPDLAVDIPAGLAGGAGGAGGAAGSGGMIAGTTGASTDTGGTVSSGGMGGMAGASTAQAVDCGSLSDPLHGSVSVTSTKVNAVASYSCMVGYTLSGLTKRTCQADGSWNGTAPTCPQVDCGTLTSPVNGKVNQTTTSYLSKATYTCVANYELSGSSSRNCQANGTWSDADPTCQCKSMCSGSCVDLKTDMNNCGQCGNLCSISAPGVVVGCKGGCLVNLVAGNNQKLAPSIAVDASFVYWADWDVGTILKAPLMGGAATTLVTGEANPHGIVVDASSVYWANQSDGTVKKASLNGGTSTLLASNQWVAGDLLLKGTYLYWATYSTTAANGSITRLLVDGGTPEALADNQDGAGDPVVDADYIYWVNSTTSTRKQEDGAIMKAPLRGGNPTTLALHQNNPHSLSYRGGSLYYLTLANSTDSAVMKLDVAGGTPVTLGTLTNTTIARTMVADAASFYIATDDALIKMPLAGATSQVFVDSLSGPWSIALDAKSVYFSNRQGANVMKMTPK